MKYFIVVFSAILIVLQACTGGKSTDNVTSSLHEDSTDTQLENPDQVKSVTSYDELITLIASSQLVPLQYYEGLEKEGLRTYNLQHQLQKELDQFILTASSGLCDAGVSCEYLITFSKKDGRIIDFVSTGQSAEGTSSYFISWNGDLSFEANDILFELEEDEEGFMIQGDPIDTTLVFSCQINKVGLFDCKYPK